MGREGRVVCEKSYVHPLLPLGGGEEETTYIFEYVAEYVLRVWSLSRLLGASPGLSIARAAAAEHAGERLEKAA